MKIYSLLKYYRRIRSPRLKLLGILLFHILHKRYLYILMDPSLACNFRCRLCFFSDPEACASMKGRFSQEDIEALSKAIFHRGLKIQIGCGAEPTTYSGLAELVKLAHDKGIPNISITTNGSLLTREKLQQLVENGLGEIILSAHGLSKETYEFMMRGSDYDHFLQLIKDVADIKKDHPELLFRINYTVCNENLDDLKQVPSLFGDFWPDIIQLRPVQDIGSTAYDNYSMSPIIKKYGECIEPVIRFCQSHQITCIYPQKEHLTIIEEENKKKEHLVSVVDAQPCINLSPHAHWKEEFNPYEETFEQFAKRTHRVRNWIKMLLGLNGNISRTDEAVTHALNYHVK